MTNRVILAGILGGVVLFIWSAISWMVLPWHMQSFKRFSNEASVAQAIQANAPQSGMYLMPSMSDQNTTSTTGAGSTSGNVNNPAAQARTSTGPAVFAAVHLEGMSSSMIPQMFIGLLIDILAALLVTYLVFKSIITSYLGRVGFIVVFAIALSVAAHLMYWNWFYFDMGYTLVAILDTIIGWFLAGLVIAGIMAPYRRA